MSINQSMKFIAGALAQNKHNRSNR